VIFSTIRGGRLAVNGTLSGFIWLLGGTLSGTGSLGDVSILRPGSAEQGGGNFEPGNSPGRIHTDDLILSSNVVVRAELAGPAVGVQYDQIEATGHVNLGGAQFQLNLEYAPDPGASFTILSNTTTAPITGIFTGLPEGAIFAAGGRRFVITYRGGDGNDVVVTESSRRLAAGGSENGVAVLYAAGAGGRYAGAPGAGLAPFGLAPFEVRVATGDVDGDGTLDTLLVTGPGVPARFAVVSGADNSKLLVPPTSVFEGFLGGAFIDAADMDGDGRAEFVITPDQGGGPRVSIFSLAPSGAVVARANFFGIDDPNFRGGARAAIGDVDKDGTPDVVVAAGFGGGPRTAIFSGLSVLAGTPTRLVNDFFAFPGSDAMNLRNGAFVAAGDLDGDGYSDLVFGGGPGGAPRVFVLSGAVVSAGDIQAAYDAPLANFFVAGNSADRGGARVAVTNADGDAKADIAVGSGPGPSAGIRVYLGKAFSSTAEPSVFQNLAPFDAQLIADGVYVG
jgi:hypothetical protein